MDRIQKKDGKVKGLLNYKAIYILLVLVLTLGAILGLVKVGNYVGNPVSIFGEPFFEVG